MKLIWILVFFDLLKTEAKSSSTVGRLLRREGGRSSRTSF
jgi:hypothetical protein